VRQPVAGIGLMLVDWPPHPAHPTQDRRGYVLNVYVEPTRRRRGLAQQLMALAEAEFAGRGVELPFSTLPRQVDRSINGAAGIRLRRCPR
jgi:ribosomal protein S18 acetylase RimI-like enzyme